MLSWIWAGRTVVGRNSRFDLMRAGPGWMRYPAEPPVFRHEGNPARWPTNVLAYRETIRYLLWYAAKTTRCRDAFADH